MYDLGTAYDKLRDYQLDCVTSIFDTFNNGADSTVAILPMSSGKTYIVGAVIKRFLEKNSKRKAVMLSHLDILTQQNEESLRKDWNLDTGILQGPVSPRRVKRCIISTMQSFCIEDKTDYWGSIEDVGLLVIDETHLYGTASYDIIVNRLPKDCIILGVTATPFRDNKDMTNLFDTIAYTISMQELIDRGMLVPPTLHHFPVTDDMETEDIHKNIVNIYYNKHKGEKSIIFLRTIEECNTLENLFRSIGVRAKAVTSKLIGPKRYECIDGFKANDAGSADVLITVSVLTAGFSSNNVRSIFLPYNISSVAAYLQRIGRGMRLDEGKDHVDIYCGGESPQLTNERYERLQRTALNTGRADGDEEYEEPVEREDDETIRYDKTTKDLSDELTKKGFQELNKLIRQQDFPQELLDNLVTAKKVQSKRLSSQAPTLAERDFLARNHIDSSKMTRLDTVYAVSSVLESKGIHPDRLYVQSGKHKGVPYQAVAPLQQKWMHHQDKRKFYVGKEVNKNLYSNLNLL